ncbi:peptide/nickel transport system ATP-binding protein/oligopeptide transport system ATP-binding protein [Tamaricihabitans halophyticus]|uniref:Peptide/nickel transport system ATP-binding protein/oligopeptide transport system ATP-binding protein n=1 Tax=Tamaricihabitans halophyticus TaxID=1262583 RepID=A0A4R2QCR7_9PSEU|nr:ABC transporter ATP-binding protein [Tamaricihabitans halophyticus]TCP46810.1 peptide/nickel transport system ATP-binding protein/oligopeptide transport system ATP-binding protein [Tamaricihabitans halophyticus]
MSAISNSATPEPLLEVRDLVKHFPITKGLLNRTVGKVHAVDGVTFRIGRGETLGLVGESGSGKSTVARLVLRLLDPTSGQIHFAGTELTRQRPAELKRLRRKLQIIFQDPFSACDPRMTIAQVVTEPLEAHRISTGKAARRTAAELLERVGLAASDLDKYPHQFSGGQAQRIGIARALTTEPELLVCDEAVSALDVSVQAQVLNLLRELQGELGLAYLFIAHDLNVVRYISDRICVMYLGQFVEHGPADELLAEPQHPYTRSLAAAIASADPHRPPRWDRIMARGEAPSPSAPPSGCRFHPRCPAAFEPCTNKFPVESTMGERTVSCHLHDAAEVLSHD